MTTESDCRDLDRNDPLAFVRDRFDLADSVIYLDGNSLGPPVRAVAETMNGLANDWQRMLIRGWWDAGWVDLPRRVGDLIAPLIGAGPGTVVCTDSTSINLYKAVVAATQLVEGDILTDSGNFPSDLYVLGSVAELTGRRLRIVDPEQVEESIEEGVVSLTQVDFRTGRRHDLPALTARAHEAGALIVWDLSHSAGAMPIDLDRHGVEMAVGCGYKYLNGGPGAPAFIYVRLDLELTNPINGWFSHRAPFDFDPAYEPATGIDRMRSGTPHVISMAVLEMALSAFYGVDMGAVRAKSEALTGAFIEMVSDLGEVLTPTEPALRGSQVSLRIEGAEDLISDLHQIGIIGDYRPPNVARFGFAPLYIRYIDVWNAAMAIREWRQETSR
ncbi:MAG: aminotransferase class V-fold PLP-dependent enzyme [Actinobacteria bacterium]|nr:aminotransferase class V-fold PLP-dependent enzyme [Actinomycetota bacterium]